MAVQNVLWLAEYLEQDATHRLVTDEQIAKWDAAGDITPVEEGNCNNMVTPGIYYYDSYPANAPDIDVVENTGVVVKVDVSTDAAIQELTLKFPPSIIEEPLTRKFIRVGTIDITTEGASLETSTITWRHWYEVGLSKILSKDEIAEYLLKDFEYVKDPDTGNYVLTEWKGTLNGEPSSELVIPETTEIQIEI